jgi:hypothetical protein
MSNLANRLSGALPGLQTNAQPNQAMRMGLNPNAGLPAGTSGYVNSNYKPVGATPGTGSQVTPQAAGVSSAIGGLASGLSQAAQTYAASVKPWQIQPSAIPDPDSFKAASVPQFQQPQPQQQQQQPVNPYMMMPGYGYR